MLRAKYNYFQNFKSRECVMKLNLKTKTVTQQKH